MNKTICELFAGVGGFRLGYKASMRWTQAGRQSGFLNGNRVRKYNGHMTAT